MKVDQILKVWALLSQKKTNFIKIGGTKKVHGPNSRGTSICIYTNAPLNFFSKAKFIEGLDFFWKIFIVTFQKFRSQI
jgi:hypothetical protein